MIKQRRAQLQHVNTIKFGCKNVNERSRFFLLYPFLEYDFISEGNISQTLYILVSLIVMCHGMMSFQGNHYLCKTGACL